MIKIRLLHAVSIISLLCFSTWSLAQNTVTDLRAVDGKIEVTLDNGQIVITPINAGTVEVVYEKNGIVNLPSFALPSDAKNSKEADIAVVESNNDGNTTNSITMRLPSFDVVVNASPLELRFERNGQLLTKEVTGGFAFETIRGFRFEVDETEKLAGGGQRILGMDRRGHRLPLYNKAHYGYTNESSQMYYSLPAILSDKHYIVGFDNSANGFLDIAHTEDNIVQFEADAGRTAFLFSAGSNMQETIEHFVSATGKQPLPPRWALGNFASRFGYKSQQQTLETIDKFIQQDFPVDAVVLDLYWFGPDIKGHMGNLQWDTNTFPEPEAMIAELKDKGVKTILITEPFILSSSSQWESAVNAKALAKNVVGEPRRFDFYFGNTGLVDVFDKESRDWFWQYYEALNQQGVAGWWGDLGEPEVHPADSLHNLDGMTVTGNEIHNVYGHRWAQMVFENQRKSRPEERPFVMMRAGFLGTQRYGMIPWTGDVDRSWGGFSSQVELGLQMSMFGLGYIHSDLGGFAGGTEFDSELYTRWMQYGVFTPVYRPHAQDHIAPEPVFHDENTQDLVRPFVKLRYELLPYNYSLALENSINGTPLMRPLAFEFPQADFSRTDAFMWGEQFLVAPVIEAGVSSMNVSLPQGKWYHYFTQQEFTGGQVAEVATPIEHMPVLVKAGAFVPKVASIQNTTEYSTKTLYVDYYAMQASASSTYTMHEDDGQDPSSIAASKVQSITFNSVESSTGLTIEAEVSGDYDSAPNMRRLIFALVGVNADAKEFTVDGNSVNVVSDKAQLYSSDAAYFDSEKQVWLVSGRLQKKLTVQMQ